MWWLKAELKSDGNSRSIAPEVCSVCSVMVLLIACTFGASKPLCAAESGQLKLRVVDDRSGEILPARVALRDANGKYPGDRLAVAADRWPNIEAHGVFISGESTFRLPVGKAQVTAACGLEYKAASQEVEIIAGQTTVLELRLARAVNMREAGWVSGDLHVHMIHGENQRPTSYEDVAVTCAANGLDFVSVGQEYVGAGTSSLDDYRAQCKKVSNERFVMFLGAERPKNILGHQVLLGCENPFLISEEPPYFKSASQIHEQGGVSVYVHPIRYYPGKQYGGEWLDFPGNNLARELIFDAYCGPSFDGLSVLSDEPASQDAHQLWFNLLNRGLFVPVFADSDACFDRTVLGFKTPGLWNTYFQIGKDTPLTQQALCEAVRRGRTMATTGPLVQFRIAEQLSGSTLPLDGGKRELRIDAFYPQHSFSLDSIDRKTKKPNAISKVELIRNGIVVKQWEPNSSEVHLAHEISESKDSWYIVRVLGSDHLWQVALTSPIYFSERTVPQKKEPREVAVKGNIYDFTTGAKRTGEVTIRRHGAEIARIIATGVFETKMPLDAEITVEADGEPAITKNLLLDYAPIHEFLWYLESRDMGKVETLDKFEFLTREVNLEFPIGYRMPGGYVVEDLQGETPLDSVRIVDGPERVANGSVAVAAVMTDVTQVSRGDNFNVAVVFRDEGAAAKCGPYVVEARGYDPSRPTGFGALKKFGEFQKTWAAAKDLGGGYKIISGSIEVSDWVMPGADGWIDLSIRARQGNSDAAFVGMVIPLGPTKRKLTLSSCWPTMPVSWPDRSYGVGPFRICNRVGRKAQPNCDYRKLHLILTCGARDFDLLPERDGKGCSAANDAMFNDHYLDQILNSESHLVR
jgi:hypothetical protein